MNGKKLKHTQKSIPLDINEFLKHYDENFINYAYENILGRIPDPSGMQYYLDKIRAGVSRVEILINIRYSAEGNARNKDILGIQQQYKLFKLLKLPILGSFLRAFGLGLIDDTPQKSIRVIENHLLSGSRKVNADVSKVPHSPNKSVIQPRYIREETNEVSVTKNIAHENSKSVLEVKPIEPVNQSKVNLLNVHPALAKNLADANVDDLGILEDTSKLIAFYLPQFHRVAENSEWWGPGFTEWTNTAKAKPNFIGHIQPHVPRELGFYDLESPAIMHEQAEMAKTYGVYGFCFYYYWFSGRRILEKPLDNFIAAKVDMPFCLCWANENWTRTWDGAESSILLKQGYEEGDEERFINDITPFFQDERYIKVNGKPLLLIYRIKQLPDPSGSIKKWRSAAKKNGINALHIAVVDFYDISSPDEVGADALVEFPPHKFNGPDNRPDVMPEFINKKFAGGILDYEKIIYQSLTRPVPSYTLYRGIIPGWDNTPRRQDTPTTIINNNPELYGKWLKSLRRYNRITKKKKSDQLIFINAWNEWGEGCHLEPDIHSGMRYLEATLKSKWYDSSLD